MSQWCDACRHLDKLEFTTFLQRYCLLSDTKLSDIADDMISRLSAPDSGAFSEDDMMQQLQALSAQQVSWHVTCAAAAQLAC